MIFDRCRVTAYILLIVTSNPQTIPDLNQLHEYIYQFVQLGNHFLRNCSDYDHAIYRFDISIIVIKNM